MPQIFDFAQKNPDAISIIKDQHKSTYGELYQSACGLAGKLRLEHAVDNGDRIAFMVHAGFGYVRAQWAVWLAGAVAVPISLSHPLPSIEYVLLDTGVKACIVSRVFKPMLETLAASLGVQLIVEEEADMLSAPLPLLSNDMPAMILYTSGTTSRPKGVVLSHGNLEAQMRVLISSWEWSSADHILCVLPLHHVHGIVNVVGCSLYVGARLEFIDGFSVDKVFEVFEKAKVNLFMAVPTIYFKLIAGFDELPEQKQVALKSAMKEFRLMVCGSAALPVTVMERWEQISGHRLLERYGMTEIGMALSNPLHGERRPGTVGFPLPGIGVRIVDEHMQELPIGEVGEILVRGPNVFSSYWRRPDATAESFTDDGWFKTGDVAVVEDGYFRILGRMSMDIIKSGGYKISALEVEEVLREYHLIHDCAVTSIPDDEWGELIVAAIVADGDVDLSVLQTWMKERIPGYKIPRRYLVLNELPRNAMGKVVKAEVKALF